MWIRNRETIGPNIQNIFNVVKHLLHLYLCATIRLFCKYILWTGMELCGAVSLTVPFIHLFCVSVPNGDFNVKAEQLKRIGCEFSIFTQITVKFKKRHICIMYSQAFCNGYFWQSVESIKNSPSFENDDWKNPDAAKINLPEG